MGNPLKVLAEAELPRRWPWNSMILVDLCENIHIHYREVRFEFTMPEFREYTDWIAHTREEVEKYLADNPEWEEDAYGDTVWKVGGGPHLLTESPEPNKSAYYPNRLLVQLETPKDHEIHVHYRNMRLDLSRQELRYLAATLANAVEQLNRYERTHGYQSRPPKSLDEIKAAIAKHHQKRPGPGHFKGLVDG